jgi:two-component system, LytTR family, response regulator
MEKLRTLIVDDEGPARLRVKQFLNEFPEADVVGEAEDGRQAVALISKQSPDLLFLDVQMPKLDGFGVINEIGAGKVPAVIFVTAHDQFALRAFESHALDYLLKPFSRERFRRAVKRAEAQIKATQAAKVGRLSSRLSSLLRDLELDTKYAARLEVKSVGRTIFVPVEEIDWIKADSNYSRLHVRKDQYLIRETLGSLEGKLDPKLFARIHRSAIVKLDRIREMRPQINGDQVVLLRDGTRLEMSRTYRDRTLDVLKGSC